MTALASCAEVVQTTADASAKMVNDFLNMFSPCFL
jgi:hypothetical protein